MAATAGSNPVSGHRANQAQNQTQGEEMGKMLEWDDVARAVKADDEGKFDVEEPLSRLSMAGGMLKMPSIVGPDDRQFYDVSLHAEGNVWGVANAFTRAAQSFTGDARVEAEKFGGSLFQDHALVAKAA